MTHDNNVICFLVDDIHKVVSIIYNAYRYVESNSGENSPLADELDQTRCFLSGGGALFPEVLKEYFSMRIAEDARKGNADVAISTVGNRFHDYG